jgi:hypothetical protein
VKNSQGRKRQQPSSPRQHVLSSFTPPSPLSLAGGPVIRESTKSSSPEHLESDEDASPVAMPISPPTLPVPEFPQGKLEISHEELEICQKAVWMDPRKLTSIQPAPIEFGDLVMVDYPLKRKTHKWPAIVLL